MLADVALLLLFYFLVLISSCLPFTDLTRAFATGWSASVSRITGACQLLDRSIAPRYFG